MRKQWDALPKSVKAIPYIVASGTLASLLVALEQVHVDDKLVMGLFNVLLLVFKDPILAIITTLKTKIQNP